MNKKTIPSSVVSSFFLLVLLPPPVNDPVRQPQRPTTTTTTKTKDKRLSLSLSLRCGSMDRPLSLWPPHWRHGRPENEDRSRAAMLRFSFVFFCFHFCFVFALVRGRLDAALMSSNRAAKSPQTNHWIRVHLFFSWIRFHSDVRQGNVIVLHLFPQCCCCCFFNEKWKLKLPPFKFFIHLVLLLNQRQNISLLSS